MKPNNEQQGDNPVDVIDTQGEVVSETVKPIQPGTNPQARAESDAEAKKPAQESEQEEIQDEAPEHTWVGPERQKLEQELQQLEARWRSTQIIQLMTRVGKELVMMDPEVKANLTEKELGLPFWAAYRATGNLIIGGLDVIPVIGDSVSGGADVLKVVKRGYLEIKKRTEKLRAKFPKFLDLTPAVPTSVAVLSEAIEPFTAGWAPTHLFVEFPMQFYADVADLIELLKKIARIKAYLKDYREAGGVIPTQDNMDQYGGEPAPDTDEAQLIKEIEEIFNLPSKSELAGNNE